jgi:hypothetical protein
VTNLADFDSEIEPIIKPRVREKFTINPRQEPARYEWLFAGRAQDSRKKKSGPMSADNGFLRSWPEGSDSLTNSVEVFGPEIPPTQISAPR